jgi:hypothetical protein
MNWLCNLVNMGSKGEGEIKDDQFEFGWQKIIDFIINNIREKEKSRSLWGFGGIGIWTQGFSVAEQYSTTGATTSNPEVWLLSEKRWIWI